MPAAPTCNERQRPNIRSAYRPAVFQIAALARLAALPQPMPPRRQHGSTVAEARRLLGEAREVALAVPTGRRRACFLTINKTAALKMLRRRSCGEPLPCELDRTTARLTIGSARAIAQAEA